MTQSRNPFRELESLYEQMQANVEDAGRWWESEPFLRASGTASVKVDLEDKPEELVLTAELPGFDTADIDARVTDHTFHLNAEHTEASDTETDGEYIRRERRQASVSRSIRLPDSVETENISATYNNGVLTVHMPKSEPADRGTKVDIA